VLEVVVRTGTDNAPISVSNAPTHIPTLGGVVASAPGNIAGLPPVAAPAIGTSADLNVPSVWRTNRTQAAAKVDALSSGGMEDYEIPAFLRRQAD
jgi:cell division protein FtsZ